VGEGEEGLVVMYLQGWEGKIYGLSKCGNITTILDTLTWSLRRMVDFSDIVRYGRDIMLAKEYGAAKAGENLKHFASRILPFGFNLSDRALIQHQRSIRWFRACRYALCSTPLPLAPSISRSELPSRTRIMDSVKATLLRRGIPILPYPR